MMVLIATLLFGGQFAEAICAANDLEQAQGRVFQALKRIIEASPLLRREAKIVANKITFPATGAIITAIASDYAGAAGANPIICSFDELWGYTLERSNRLWDELVPPPTRKIACRLTTTYAGFEGESKLLEDLYKRGLEQPQIGTDLVRRRRPADVLDARPGRAVADAGVDRADARSTPAARLRPDDREPLRAFRRDLSSTWLTGTRVASAPQSWPTPTYRSGLASMPASRETSTAIVAVTWDRGAGKARWSITGFSCRPRVSRSTSRADVEGTLLELKHRYRVREVRYDPYQMQSCAQRMRKAGINMVEFPKAGAEPHVGIPKPLRADQSPEHRSPIATTTCV